MATIPWYTIRHMLARRVGDHIAGTATGGSTTTLVDATRRKERDNALIGLWCKIYSGTASEAERRLSANTQSTGTLTHASTTWTTPDTTSLYELHRLMEAAQYDEYLKEALRWLTRGRYLLAPSVDTSLTIVADQYDYDVPGGMIGIEKVEFSTETGSPDSDEYDYVPDDRWYIRRSSTRKLVFNKKFGLPVASTVIRVTGFIEFGDPTSDAHTFNLDANPIVAVAAVNVSLALAVLVPSAHWDRFHQRALELQERTLARILEQRLSTVKWVEPL